MPQTICTTVEIYIIHTIVTRCVCVFTINSNSLYGRLSAGQEDGVQFLEERESEGEREVVVVQRMVVGHQAMLQVVHWEGGHVTPGGGGGGGEGNGVMGEGLNKGVGRSEEEAQTRNGFSMPHGGGSTQTMQLRCHQLITILLCHFL